LSASSALVLGHERGYDFDERFQVVDRVYGDSHTWLVLEASMRAMIVTLVLLLNGIDVGQQDKPGDRDQTVQLKNPVTKQQLLELPRRDKPPQISLKRALKIAENLIKKEKIDISSCYLFEAKWVSTEIDEEPSWRFWWVSLRGKSPSDNDLRIIVSGHGRPKILFDESVVGFTKRGARPFSIKSQR
jgi:hypothetical protein